MPHKSNENPLLMTHARKKEGRNAKKGCGCGCANKKSSKLLKKFSKHKVK